MATRGGTVRSATDPAPAATEAAAGAAAVGPQAFPVSKQEINKIVEESVTAALQKVAASGVAPQNVSTTRANQLVGAAKHTLPISLDTFREAYRTTPDVVERAKLISFMRDTLRRPDWADDIEGRPWQPGMWSSVKLSTAQSPSWRTIGYIAVGTFGILLVYDAVALWFDLPRIGILPKSGGGARGR